MFFSVYLDFCLSFYLSLSFVYEQTVNIHFELIEMLVFENLTFHWTHTHDIE